MARTAKSRTLTPEELENQGDLFALPPVAAAVVAETVSKQLEIASTATVEVSTPLLDPGTAVGKVQRLAMCLNQLATEAGQENPEQHRALLDEIHQIFDGFTEESVLDDQGHFTNQWSSFIPTPETQQDRTVWDRSFSFNGYYERTPISMVCEYVQKTTKKGIENPEAIELLEYSLGKLNEALTRVPEDLRDAARDNAFSLPTSRTSDLPMSYAIDSATAVKMLLDAGVKPESAAETDRHRQPVAKALSRNLLASADLLSKAGATAVSPLYLQAQKIENLGEEETDFNDSASVGENFLHLAYESPDSIAARSCFGDTPLHKAAATATPSTIKELLNDERTRQACATALSTLDNGRNSPIEVALTETQFTTARLLIEHHIRSLPPSPNNEKIVRTVFAKALSAAIDAPSYEERDNFARWCVQNIASISQSGKPFEVTSDFNGTQHPMLTAIRKGDLASINMMLGESVNEAPFKDMVADYFRHDPAQKQTYAKVQSYAEWARENGKEPNPNIDLVATTHTGEVHAIQSKYHPTTTPVQTGHFGRFLTASGTDDFAARVIVTPTDSWSSRAEEQTRRLTPPVKVLRLSDLASSQIDWLHWSAGAQQPPMRDSNTEADKNAAIYFTSKLKRQHGAMFLSTDALQELYKNSVYAPADQVPEYTSQQRQNEFRIAMRDIGDGASTSQKALVLLDEDGKPAINTGDLALRLIETSAKASPELAQSMIFGKAPNGVSAFFQMAWLDDATSTSHVLRNYAPDPVTVSLAINPPSRENTVSLLKREGFPEDLQISTEKAHALCDAALGKISSLLERASSYDSYAENNGIYDNEGATQWLLDSNAFLYNIADREFQSSQRIVKEVEGNITNLMRYQQVLNNIKAIVDTNPKDISGVCSALFSLPEERNRGLKGLETVVERAIPGSAVFDNSDFDTASDRVYKVSSELWELLKECSQKYSGKPLDENQSLKPDEVRKLLKDWSEELGEIKEEERIIARTEQLRQALETRAKAYVAYMQSFPLQMEDNRATLDQLFNHAKNLCQSFTSGGEYQIASAVTRLGKPAMQSLVNLVISQHEPNRLSSDDLEFNVYHMLTSANTEKAKADMKGLLARYAPADDADKQIISLLNAPASLLIQNGEDFQKQHKNAKDFFKAASLEADEDAKQLWDLAFGVGNEVSISEVMEAHNKLLKAVAGQMIADGRATEKNATKKASEFMGDYITYDISATDRIFKAMNIPEPSLFDEYDKENLDTFLSHIKQHTGGNYLHVAMNIIKGFEHLHREIAPMAAEFARSEVDGDKRKQLSSQMLAYCCKGSLSPEKANIIVEEEIRAACNAQESRIIRSMEARKEPIELPQAVLDQLNEAHMEPVPGNKALMRLYMVKSPLTMRILEEASTIHQKDASISDYVKEHFNKEAVKALYADGRPYIEVDAKHARPIADLIARRSLEEGVTPWLSQEAHAKYAGHRALWAPHALRESLAEAVIEEQDKILASVPEDASSPHIDAVRKLSLDGLLDQANDSKGFMFIPKGMDAERIAHNAQAIMMRFIADNMKPEVLSEALADAVVSQHPTCDTVTLRDIGGIAGEQFGSRFGLSDDKVKELQKQVDERIINFADNAARETSVAGPLSVDMDSIMRQAIGNIPEDKVRNAVFNVTYISDALDTPENMALAMAQTAEAFMHPEVDLAALIRSTRISADESEENSERLQILVKFFEEEIAKKGGLDTVPELEEPDEDLAVAGLSSKDPYDSRDITPEERLGRGEVLEFN